MRDKQKLTIMASDSYQAAWSLLKQAMRTGADTRPYWRAVNAALDVLQYVRDDEKAPHSPSGE